MAAANDIPEIKIAGATTVFLSVVKTNKEAVAKETQTNINAVGSTTGTGFAALQAGQIDIAMSTDTLAGLAAAAAKKDASFSPADYQEYFIKTANLVFICHKSNPVSSLTEAQIKGILTGQIKKWSEVGGTDRPIAIYYEREASGNYGLLKKNLLKDEALATRGLTYVDNARLIVGNVSDVETSIGPTSDFYLNGSVKVIEGFKVPQNLCFITKKNPTTEVLRVIEAFKAKVK
jgi:ABC-type phosphate transport system substrate-binding protein